MAFLFVPWNILLQTTNIELKELLQTLEKRQKNPSKMNLKIETKSALCRFVGSASKASDVFLFGLHPKIKPETFLVGSEAYKLEVHHTCFCVVFTQPEPRDHLLSSE